jgi:MscS family membrane protein
MKLKFETAVRWCVAVLLLGLLWSIWASAQDKSTNAPALTSTNSTRLLSGLSEFDQNYLTFGLDQWEYLREHTWFGEPYWKYLASLIYVFLAFYISKFFDYLTRVWLKKWTSKTETKLDDLVLDLLNGPIKMVVFVVLLFIGLDVFRWPASVQLFLSRGLIIFVAVSLTFLSIKLIDAALGYWRQRAKATEDEQFNKELLPMIRNSLKVFVILVAFLVTSQNLGLNITGLVASLSIGGLALGLAAQDTLANLFGAVSVLVDKPFRIGDRIQLDNVDGVVEQIGFRSTRVRNQDGHLVTIPNKAVGNATITNIALRPNIRTLMNVGITYDTPTEKVKRALQILEEVYRSNPMTLDVWISFNKFADSALNIQIIHWWNSTDYKIYLAGMQEFNLRIKERFDQEGIDFAFPTQTLHVKEGVRPFLSAEAGQPPLLEKKQS